MRPANNGVQLAALCAAPGAGTVSLLVDCRQKRPSRRSSAAVRSQLNPHVKLPGTIAKASP